MAPQISQVSTSGAVSEGLFTITANITASSGIAKTGINQGAEGPTSGDWYDIKLSAAHGQLSATSLRPEQGSYDPNTGDFTFEFTEDWALNEGDWTITIKATDTNGTSSTAQVSINVNNSILNSVLTTASNLDSSIFQSSWPASFQTGVEDAIRMPAANHLTSAGDNIQLLQDAKQVVQNSSLGNKSELISKIDDNIDFFHNNGIQSQPYLRHEIAATLEGSHSLAINNNIQVSKEGVSVLIGGGPNCFIILIPCAGGTPPPFNIVCWIVWGLCLLSANQNMLTT